MLEGYSPVTQALLGTLFTWGLTAAGAALVFVFSSRQVIKKQNNKGFKGWANALKKYFSMWSVCFATVSARVTTSTMKMRQRCVSTD